MSPSPMNIAMKTIQAGVFAGLLAFAASCTSTSTSGGLMPAPGDSLASQAGGVTDDPAAGFENNQPGSEEDFILSAGRRIYFTEGSATLDETARATVDNQIAFLRKYPRWFAQLLGFADDPGSNAQMVQLSQQRADAVKDAIVSQGGDGSRIEVQAFGDTKLKYGHSDGRNRRVSIEGKQ